MIYRLYCSELLNNESLYRPDEFSWDLFGSLKTRCLRNRAVENPCLFNLHWYFCKPLVAVEF